MRTFFKRFIIFILSINSLYSTECNMVDRNFETRVIASSDDVEELLTNNSIYMTSSDLELTQDGLTNQLIGIRFQNIPIPQGATVTKAYIRFTVDEVSTGVVNLTIYGEDSDNSQTFLTTPNNVSSRAKTAHSISWSPKDWLNIGDSTTDQTTPDLKDIIQEIVDRSGWSSGNSMSFIIEGYGRRTAESFDGEEYRAPVLYIEYQSCDNIDDTQTNTTATCYALTDNSDKLYKVTMLPNASVLPIPSIVSISETFNGEGSAYRASDNKFYAFKAYGDNIGPSDLYTIDVDSGDIFKVKDNIISGTVDGAEFYFNPTLNREILYLISGEDNSKLYAFDPENWTILDGYPKDTNTDLSSLAIDPVTGEAYAIDDYNYDGKAPKVYKLNLATGETTQITTLQNLADAEGLAFASDGNLYIEDEGRNDLDGKKLYKLDLNTGELIPSAITDTSGDIEGLSCNGTQMALEKPSIKIEDANITEGNSGAIVNLNFLVTLSRPSDGKISFKFLLYDGNSSNPDLNAILDSDYKTPDTDQITIDENQTQYIISIPIVADNTIENNESFYIKLEDIDGAIVERDFAVGTILDDDTQSSIGCIESAFMFQNRPTDINILNLVDGNLTLLRDDISTDNINALGFNKKDGYFWGYNYTKSNGTIVRIGYDENGEWEAKEFFIEGLDGFLSYVGDIDSNGHLYLKESGSSKRVVVVDLDGNSSTYLKKIKDFYLDTYLSIADWAFNPKDNMLYAVNNATSLGVKYLYKIDPQTGEVLSKADISLGGDRLFGASFFDADGFYYIYDNTTGEIYRIDVANSPKAVLFAKGSVVTYNDGAMCSDTKFRFDFGDLPENYPTTLSSNGARHSLPIYQNPSIYLGDTITSESEGLPSSGANLDIGDDGVTILGSTLQDKLINGGADIVLNVKTVGEGFLNGWVDFNGDGDFNDTNEQIAQDIFSRGGEIELNISVPNYAKDLTTYARFRYSSTKNLASYGVALDGEVEDYRFTIKKNLEEFVCDSRLYLSNNTQSALAQEESSSTTWLHQFNIESPTFMVVGGGSEIEYGAIGYNLIDNFLYALYKNNLLQIDSNGIIRDLGEIEGLPSEDFKAGAFDRDGYYFVSGDGDFNSKLYKIDILQKKVIESFDLALEGDSQIKFLDMAIDSSNSYFYAMLLKEMDSKLINDKFVKIDKNSGQIYIVGDNYTDIDYISSIYIDGNNKILVMPNSGNIYEIDLDTTKAYLLKVTPAISSPNDGANCPDANFILPPRIPRLSISDVSKAEGDSGETNFEFEVSIDTNLPYIPIVPMFFYYKVIDGDGNEVIPPRGVATTADNDFKGESGIAVNMNIFSQSRTQTITVTVYGDRKVELDEEFYVDIYFPQPLPQDFCMVGKSRGVGVILNDDMKFKVIRVDGDLENANLYTQVVNRDFDYSIISYNGEVLNKLRDITLKIELIDNTTNQTLYRDYKYIDSTTRVDILDEDDLSISQATKDATFRVSFLKDENGTIVHGDYALEDSYNALLNSSRYYELSQDASDHFAIRPAGFNISIGDNNGSIIYVENNKTQTSPINLVAGYNYYIEAKAVDLNGSIIGGYTTIAGDLNTTLLFRDNLNCRATEDISKSYNFNNGVLKGDISHTNVGKYRLHMRDSSWSSIDEVNGDCVVNSFEIPDDKNSKVGCDIVSNIFYPDIDLKFNPYQFKAISYVKNIPDKQRNYIYMSDLDKSLKMGIELITNIEAEDKSGNRVTNFTSSCEAEDLEVTLDFTIETDTNSSSGDIPIKTVYGSEVKFERVISFNGVAPDIADVEESNLSRKITIPASKFLDLKDGNSTISTIVNLNRNYSEPTNPVVVTLSSLDINSSTPSKLKGSDFFASGVSNIGVSKILYYASIIPDRENYGDEFDGVVKTPINALIYCKKTTAWCSQKIGSNGLNNVKTVDGWYRAIEHDSTIDGRVNAFIISNPLSKVTPDANNLPNFNEGVEGRIDDIVTGYGGNSYPSEVVVEMDVSEWLKYHKDPARAGVAFWKITFRDKNATWSGVGEAGNQVEIKTTTKPAKKISW